MFTTIATRDIMKWNFKEWLRGICFHQGRTDQDGGHRDVLNKSGLGYYHYHHGLPAHLHPHEIFTPEIAMYEYIHQKLTDKNYNIAPKPYNYVGSETAYTVGGIKKPFVNNGKLLLGHKIIVPEDIYNTLKIIPDTGPTSVISENIARHSANDDFNSIHDAALAFILRYSSQAQSMGKYYYTAVCIRTYITTPDTPTPAPSYYFCPYEIAPFSLEIAKRRFPKFDTKALVFTNSTPAAWFLDYRNEIVDSFRSSSILPVYYMLGKNIYCWSSLLIDRTKDLLCSLEGFEPKVDTDLSDYPKDDNLRLKAEIIELLTEVCDSVNSRGGRTIEPWVLLGMWAQEDGNHVKSGNIVNYYAGVQNACVYKDIMTGSINVINKSSWDNGVTWGDGKTGLILNANSSEDGLKIGNGAILSGGTPYVNHAVGPFQFEPVYFIGNKNTNDYKQNYIFNSKHISMYSDINVGEKSLVNEQLNWGGLNNLQKKDSKLGALIGHDIYRPHVAYLPDSSYNACMILYHGANSYKTSSGIESLAGYSTLTEEGKKYVDYAFALISHNAWTTNAKSIMPNYINVQKNDGLLSWTNNPPEIKAAVQIIGGSADFTGYGLTCLNYGKFLWDKWTEEVNNAEKSSHSHVN